MHTDNTVKIHDRIWLKYEVFSVSALTFVRIVKITGLVQKYICMLFNVLRLQLKVIVFLELLNFFHCLFDSLTLNFLPLLLFLNQLLLMFFLFDFVLLLLS